ncbi:ATPase [Schleiferilactobacillus harbinensis]|nr:ATPase [Schleiferilactobacillus harbinensis]
MESDGLVILSGLSGTGKSQLVRAYAKALGLIIGDSQSSQSSKKLCFVPVRPFWADDSDLLGYADMVNNVYRPGDSGLVDTLVSANEHKDQLFIVVFDEMNLARVEHYFSQFLSVLEMPLSSRYIRLYNSQLKTRLYNSQQYPDHIAIRDNVLFVGTVNTDESTFQFSDKVLDRSNVISLHILPFNKEYKVADETAISSEQGELTTSEYRALGNQDDKKPLTQKEKSLLWDLHVTLNEEDRNLGIGWRIVHQIDSFVRNLPEIDDGVSRGEAIDLQLVQRILTKVRGSQEQLHDLLGTGKEPGKLIQVLDKYTDISTFEQSRLLLTQKTQELTLYGFTM